MTPEEEEQVRRALVDAGDADRPASMPAEVAARMEDVLVGLVAERRPTGAPAREDELAARRRRRSRRALVAAAAVCAVALGGPVVLRTVTSDGPGSATSADRPARGTGGGTAPAPGPSAPSAGSSRAFAEGSLPAPRLRRATLERDVRRVAEGTTALAAPRNTGKGLSGRRATAEGCAVPVTTRDDDVLAVLLDGEPATLVLTAPRNGAREARVYSCDDGSAPTATTRVPAG